MKIRLNLGCGTDIRDGWINCDIDPCNSMVEPIDLNVLPLPFDSNSVDEICLSHVLEHLNVNHILFMDELHRILKHGGSIDMRLPVHENIIQHTKMSFSPKYFKFLENNLKLFTVTSFKKHTKIKDFIYKIKEYCMEILYSEYRWVLKKQ